MSVAVAFWLGGAVADGFGQWFVWRQGNSSAPRALLAALLWPAASIAAVLRIVREDQP